jgi:16S rRNA (cytosine1402-N4)-methyltransferase
VCEDAERAARAHLPVLADEVMFLLRPRDEGWVVDGTVGMGGHSERLMESGDGRSRLLGVDADGEALRRAGVRLARFGDRIVLRHGSFRGLGSIAAEAGVTAAAAILLDLGMSSYQLGESGRGFSFQNDEELDMRFDPATGPTAADLLNRLPVEELARIIFEYGEERHARRIARGIDDRRQRAPLARTGDLVGVVKGAVPRAAWPRRLHVATRTFQALRIAVNDEMQALTEALPQAAALLAPGGRIGVISFHSGEDRIVKRSFRMLSQEGGYVDREPAPIEATADEIFENPRARSAKLRVLERVAA